MTMILTTSAEPDFLRAVIRGEFSSEEAERTFIEIMDAVTQHKSDKVLLDGRDVTGEPTTMQRFYYGEFAAATVARYSKESRKPGPKFAYVLVEPVLDPARFGEVVAVNRGMNIKVFENLAQALGWLKFEPDKPDGNNP